MLGRDGGVVGVSELPLGFQPVYPAFRYFNAVQSEAFPLAFGTDHNMVRAPERAWHTPRPDLPRTC